MVEDTPDLRLYLYKADDLLAVVNTVDGLKVVYDSGNMILAGEDPLPSAARWAAEFPMSTTKIWHALRQAEWRIPPPTAALIHAR